MRAFTLAQLRTKVQQRADIETSRHFTPAEIDGLINTAYAELYEILVQSGRHYFEATQVITTAGTNTVALQANYLATLRVDWIPSTGRRIRLREVQVAELERWPAIGSFASGYRVVGTNLLLYSTPPAGQTYEHLYVPACPILAVDGDTVDGVGGWEEFLVVDAAIRVGIKEETDVGVLLQEREQLRARIAQAAEDRQLLSTSRVIDAGDQGPRDEGAWDVDSWWR